MDFKEKILIEVASQLGYAEAQGKIKFTESNELADLTMKIYDKVKKSNKHYLSVIYLEIEKYKNNL